MRPALKFAAACLLFLVAATSLAAQLGVERRIDRRLDRRADAGNPNAAARLQDRNPNAWRMRRYNDEWWYYTPQTTWMYYRDNRWSPYDQSTFRPLTPNATGYRGTYTSRVEPRTSVDRYAYGKAGAPSLTVSIYDNYFEPASINVAPGTTVTWINYGAHDHTITGAQGTWDSGEIGPDGTYSARFKQPGTYQYVCDLHEGMSGTIVVGGP